MKYLVYILLFGVLFGCRDKDVAGGVRYLDDKSELLDFGAVIEEIDFVQPAAQEGFLIGGIRQLANHEDRWFILGDDPRNALFVFDNDGNPVKSYDRQGRAPGEYIEIVAFDIDPDSGDILLLGPAKIIVLDKELEFKREIETKSLYERGVFYGDGLLLYSYYGSRVDHLSLEDLKFDKVFEFTGDKGNAISPATTVFIRDGSDVYFHVPEIDDLYKVDNGEFNSVVTVDYAYREEARKLYTDKGFVNMSMEERSKHSRPRIMCVINRDGRLSFIYNKLVSYVNIDKGDGLYENRNIGPLVGSVDLIKVKDRLVGWTSAANIDENTFNKFHYFDGIKINYPDASGAETLANGNPALVVYKLK